MLAINALTSQTQVNVKGEDNFWKNGVVYHNLLRDDVRQMIPTAIRETKLAFSMSKLCSLQPWNLRILGCHHELGYELDDDFAKVSRAKVQELPSLSSMASSSSSGAPHLTSSPSLDWCTHNHLQQHLYNTIESQ